MFAKSTVVVLNQTLRHINVRLYANLGSVPMKQPNEHISSDKSINIREASAAIHVKACVHVMFERPY